MDITIREFINYAAKAVAAFLTPLVILGLSRVGAFINFDFGLESSQIETWISTLVVSAITALVVYFKANKQPG